MKLQKENNLQKMLDVNIIVSFGTPPFLMIREIDAGGKGL